MSKLNAFIVLILLQIKVAFPQAVNTDSYYNSITGDYYIFTESYFDNYFYMEFNQNKIDTFYNVYTLKHMVLNYTYTVSNNNGGIYHLTKNKNRKVNLRTKNFNKIINVTSLYRDSINYGLIRVEDSSKVFDKIARDSVSIYKIKYKLNCSNTLIDSFEINSSIDCVNSEAKHNMRIFKTKENLHLILIHFECVINDRRNGSSLSDSHYVWKFFKFSIGW